MAEYLCNQRQTVKGAETVQMILGGEKETSNEVLTIPELETRSVMPPPGFLAADPARSALIKRHGRARRIFVFKYCLQNESDLNAGLFRRDSENVPVSPLTSPGVLSQRPSSRVIIHQKQLRGFVCA